MGIFDRESDVIVNGAPGGTRIMGHTDVPDNGGYLAQLHAGERITPARDLTVKLNVDVSDALTGLKALRREADAAVRSLNSVNEAKRERTLSDYTTRELTDELARRTGVREIVIPPHKVVGITLADGTDRSIAGPARILINVD
ncbi:BC1881 family protein [Brevibacillus brevis]|uniref:BC1881 family protein n=1 Tax=Brevibacillus brevis TaxID=1393 RepID=UPI00165E9038|nr:BC1881 family protein [Brevibacillus brevis]